MRMWIDADRAPSEMKEIVFRAGKRLSFETMLVANRSLFVPAGYPQVRAVCVPGGPDAAEQHIATNAEAGDVAVTASSVLAATLLDRQVSVIDPRGEEAAHGVSGKSGRFQPYGAREKQAFAATLDRVLTRVLRSRP